MGATKSCKTQVRGWGDFCKFCCILYNKPKPDHSRMFESRQNRILVKRAKFYGVPLLTNDKKEHAEVLALAALNNELSAVQAKNLVVE